MEITKSHSNKKKTNKLWNQGRDYFLYMYLSFVENVFEDLGKFSDSLLIYNLLIQNYHSVFVISVYLIFATCYCVDSIYFTWLI